MAIAFKTATELSTTVAGTTHAITLPSFNADDIIIVSAAWNGSPSTVTNDGEFWQVFRTQWGGESNPKNSLWWRRMQTGDSTTLTITTTNSVNAGIGAACFSGVHTGSAFDVAALQGSGTSTTDHVAPSLTTATANTMMVCGASGNSSSQTYTPPSGMTEATDSNAATSGGKAHSIAYQAIASAGSTGTKTFTCSSSLSYGSYSLALREAGTNDAGPVIESWSYNTTEGTADSTIVLAEPDGLATDDLILILVSNEAGNTQDWPAITTPDAYTQIAHPSNSADCQVSIYWRVADSTETWPITIDHAGVDYAVGWALRISGANTTTPIDVEGAWTGEDSTAVDTITAASVTTTEDDCLVIALIGYDGSDMNPSSTTSTGWGAPVSLADLIDISGGAAADWWSKSVGTAGASGALVATFVKSITDGAMSIQIAIAPSAAGTTEVTQTTTVTYSVEAEVTQTTTVDFETLAEVDQTTTVDHETLSEVAPATTTVDFETLAEVDQTTTLTYDVAGAVAQTTTVDYETLAEVDQTTTVTYETFTDVAQTTTVDYATFAEVTQTTTVDFDVAGEVAQSTAVDYETLSEVDQSTVIDFETLVEVTQTTTVDFETLSEATQTTTVTYDTLATGGTTEVTQTTTVDYETLAEVDQTTTVDHATLAEVDQTTTVDYETLIEVAESTTPNYATLAEVTQTTTVDHETFAFTLQTTTLIYQVAGEIAQSTVVDYETLSEIYQTVTVDYATLAVVTQSTVVDYETFADATIDIGRAHLLEQRWRAEIHTDRWKASLQPPRWSAELTQGPT